MLWACPDGLVEQPVALLKQLLLSGCDQGQGQGGGHSLVQKHRLLLAA